MNTVIRIISGLIIAFATVSAYALSQTSSYTWVGADGASWSDVSNWRDSETKETVATAPDEGTLVVVPAAFKGTMAIDGARRCFRLSLEESENEGQDNAITFAGTGSLTCESTTTGSYCWKWRKLIVKCPLTIRQELNHRGKIVVENEGNLVLEKNCKLFVQYQAPELIVNGGRATLNTFSCGDKGSVARIAVNGGVVKLTALPPTNASIDFSHLGGELIWKDGDGAATLTDIAYFPKNTASILNVPFVNNYKTAINPLNNGSEPLADGAVVPVEGLTILTNGYCSAYTLSLSGMTLKGAGDLALGRLRIDKAGTHTLDFRELCIGSVDASWNPVYGIWPYVTGITLKVPNGITFGSHADWSVYSDKNPTIDLDGEIVFDTLDYFDRTTTHAISLPCVKANGTTAFRVKGGGSVEIGFKSTPPRMESIVVESDSTLKLSAPVKAVQLSLGANARLMMSGGGSIDAENASIDPTARIVFAADVRSETGFRRLVQVRPGSTAAAQLEAVVDVSALTETPPTVSAGSVFYPVEETAAKVKYQWTGASSAIWKTSGNWYQALPYSSNDAFFNGLVENADITIDNGPAVQRLKFLSECGPYSINGNDLMLKAGGTAYNAGVRSYSRFPVVLNNRIYTSGNALQFASTRDSYILIAGGADIDATFSVIGDVRVASKVTAPSINLQYSTSTTDGFYDSKIPYSTSLCVLDGGCVSITNNVAPIDTTAPVAVREGGRLDVAGSCWGWANGKSGAIRVDGTMSVSAPLGGYGQMSYDGCGRLELSGGTSEALANYSVVLGGDISCAMPGWDAAASGFSVPIQVVGKDVKIVATADGSYEGAALMVATGAKLTFLTSDPAAQDAAAHVFTVNNPIRCDGDFVKAGKGTLVINAANCTFDKGIVIEDGAMAFAEAVTVPSISFAEGAGLALSGGGAVVTVESAVDVEGLVVAIDKPEEISGWTTILSSTVGISGTPTGSSDLKLRIVNGTELQAKSTGGCVIILR